MGKIFCFTLCCTAYRIDMLQKLTSTAQCLLLESLHWSTNVTTRPWLRNGRQGSLIEFVNQPVDLTDGRVAFTVTRSSTTSHHTKSNHIHGDQELHHFTPHTLWSHSPWPGALPLHTTHTVITFSVTRSSTTSHHAHSDLNHGDHELHHFTSHTLWSHSRWPGAPPLPIIHVCSQYNLLVVVAVGK